jgi:hypothetical protein
MAPRTQAGELVEYFNRNKRHPAPAPAVQRFGFLGGLNRDVTIRLLDGLPAHVDDRWRRLLALLLRPESDRGLRTPTPLFQA